VTVTAGPGLRAHKFKSAYAVDMFFSLEYVLGMMNLSSMRERLLSINKGSFE
jgi:hypothetical protein